MSDQGPEIPPQFPQTGPDGPDGPDSPADRGSTIGERFTDVFTNPRRAMQGVVEKPAWSIPFLVIFLLMLLYSAANVQLITMAQQESMREFLPPGQEEVFEEQMEQYRDPSVGLRVWQGIQTGMGTVFIALLVPAVVLFAFSRLSEGTGSFSGTLGVVFWSGLILYGLKTVLSWMVLVLTGSVRVSYLSLQSLVPQQNPFHPAYVASGLLGDPFMWWMLLVVALGLARVHAVSEKRALTVVLVTHGLLAGVMIGLVAVGRAFMSRVAG
jgi:hypothetical protein